MIKGSFALCFTFLLLSILVSLFLFAKYNAAEVNSYKPNLWKYKHTNKRHSVTHCLIWSAAIMIIYQFVKQKKRYFKLWCKLYVIYMQAFLGFPRSFLKLIRCQIVKSWLKEIKRHFFFQKSLFFSFGTKIFA